MSQQIDLAEIRAMLNEAMSIAFAVSDESVPLFSSNRLKNLHKRCGNFIEAHAGMQYKLNRGVKVGSDGITLTMQYGTTKPQPDLKLAEARKALSEILKRDQRNTCQHENTHRGGYLWEICDDCGMKWADDEGGKPEWVEPPEWKLAEKVLGDK